MNNKASARVLIVDDNPVIRTTLSGIIRHDPTLTVVGQAWSGEAALESVESHKPDVVCLDVNMPGIGGLDVLRRLREGHPTIRVVIITGEATSEIVKEALTLGAHGFVVKPFNAEKVLTAIHTALSGPAQK
jgi:two-component system, chemotaxis family, chemotaxis protein CheY